MDARPALAALSRDEVFVDLVSFKWLMAGVGCRIDLPRMRHDATYASECASRGLLAHSALLQQRSRELLALLGPQEPPALPPRGDLQ